MKLRIIMALWAVLFCLASTTAFAEESQAIVTVNIQEVLLGSASGQVVKGVLENKVAEYQKKFQQDQAEVEALQAEIEKKSSVWSDDVKEEKERAYQKRVRELQQKSEDAQYELQQLEKESMEPVLKELQQVIKDLGEKNGYAMILDSRAGLLYVDDSLDISEQVTKELDARHQSEKK
jgi:outer membrane protein